MRRLIAISALVSLGLVSACARPAAPTVSAVPAAARADVAATASPTPSPVGSAATATASPSGAACPGPAPTTSPWTTGPLTVTKNIPVPPVPVVVGIRAASHEDEGFDRIVFDIDGCLPGYDVRYVSEVVGDASGQPISVPGQSFLKITFRPAQAHNEAGQSTLTAQAQTLNFAMLKAYAVTGDFEGVFSVVLGLGGVARFRVGELDGMIFLDVDP